MTDSIPEKSRVQKILAAAGVASRRDCEELIRRGCVKVNGEVIKLGDKALETDDIKINGRSVKIEKKVYIILNKPRFYVTTTSEEHGMKTVLDLVKVEERIFPVGRLDRDAEGLLFLTNDGDLANKLSHPRYEVEKEYSAELDKPFKDVENLKKGVTIDKIKVEIKNVKVTASNKVQVTIHEGRKHIVKEIFKSLGYKVTFLKRIRFGPLELKNVVRGTWRHLSNDELEALKAHA